MVEINSAELDLSDRLDHVRPVACIEMFRMVRTIRATIRANESVSCLEGLDGTSPDLRLFSEDVRGTDELENSDVGQDAEHFVIDTA